MITFTPDINRWSVSGCLVEGRKAHVIVRCRMHCKWSVNRSVRQYTCLCSLGVYLRKVNPQWGVLGHRQCNSNIPGFSLGGAFCSMLTKPHPTWKVTGVHAFLQFHAATATDKLFLGKWKIRTSSDRDVFVKPTGSNYLVCVMRSNHNVSKNKINTGYTG